MIQFIKLGFFVVFVKEPLIFLAIILLLLLLALVDVFDSVTALFLLTVLVIFVFRAAQAATTLASVIDCYFAASLYLAAAEAAEAEDNFGGVRARTPHLQHTHIWLSSCLLDNC